MAAGDTRVLLTKWGIDTTDWKKAIADIKAQFVALREQSKTAAAEDKANLAWQLDQLRKNIGALRDEAKARQDISKGIEKQVQQEKLSQAAAATATSQAKAQATQAAAAAAQQVAIQKQLIVEAQAKVAQERAATAEIQKQNALYRQQQSVARKSGGGGGEGGGFLGGLTEGFASKLAGTIGFAVLSAEGLGRVLEDIFQKVKSFVEESGPLTLMRAQFEKLAAVKGYNAVQFLDQLRTATHNLTGDMALYRTANLAMQSGLQITQKRTVDLVQATVSLGRANNHDATESLNALNRAFLTGQTRSLAWVVGIQKAQMQTQGLSRGLDEVTKSQLTFDAMSDKVIAMWKKYGDTGLTLTDRITELNVVWDRFFEDISQTALASGGAKSLMDTLGGFVDKIASAGNIAESIGNKVGEVLGVIAEAAKTFEAAISAAFKAVKAAIDLVADAVNSFADKTDDVKSRLTTFTGLMQTMAGALIITKAGFQELGNYFDYLSHYSIPQLIGSWTGLYHLNNAEDLVKMKQTLSEYVSEAASPALSPTMKLAMQGKISDMQSRIQATAQSVGWGTKLDSQNSTVESNMRDDLQSLQDNWDKKGGMTLGGGSTGGEGVVAPEETMQQQQQMLALQLQLKKATSKAELDVVKQQIEDEKNANQEAYDSGVKAFQEYISQRKALEEAQHQAKLKEIDDDTSAQIEEQQRMLNIQTSAQNKMLAGIGVQLKNPSLTPDGRQELLNQQSTIQSQVTLAKNMAEMKMEMAVESANQQYAQEDMSYQRGEQQLTTTVIKETQKRAVEAAETELKAFEETEKEKEKILKDSLDSQNISAYSYTQQMIDGKNAELTAFTEAENAKAAASGNTSAAQNTALDNVLTKTIEIMDQISDLWRGLPKLATDESKKAYDGNITFLKAQLQEAQAIEEKQNNASRPGGVKGGKTNILPGVDVTKAQQELDDALHAHVSVLESELPDALENDRAKFAALTDEIAKTNAEIAQLEEKASKLQVSAAIGSGFSEMSSAFGTFKQGRSIGYATQALGEASTTTSQLGSNSLSQLLGVFDDLTKSGGATAKNFQKLQTELAGTINQVGSFVNALQGNEGVAGSTIGGGISGYGLGGQLGGLAGKAGGAIKNMGAAPEGSLLSGIGGALSSVGSFLGPAGAIIGAFTSMFAAKAQAAAKVIENNIQTATTQIIANLNEGNASISATIAALQQQQQSANDQLSGNKSGRKDLPQINQNFQQQIAQLQAQADQVQAQFNEQLQVAAAPDVYQQYISNMQSLIQQYEQYISAGGDVVTANQYLADSFNTMVGTDTTQLLQSYQSAVQDALNLGDLLVQQQQLTQNYTLGIQGIINQGVLVRQNTVAQQKGVEIDQMTQQYDQQMEQLNQQIAVTTYRVQAESQIFSLAQTRVGLETQLVALQNIQTTQDMQRIAALQSLVGALSNGSLLNAITTNNSSTSPTTANQAMLAALIASLLGATAGTSSVGSLESTLQNEYNSQAQSGLGGFYGELG